MSLIGILSIISDGIVHLFEIKEHCIIIELTVEPIRSDGEVSARYIESIVARLREVGISRAIADLKSNLQRLNPVENGEEYNAAFASLVALETTRRGLHDLAVGSL